MVNPLSANRQKEICPSRKDKPSKGNEFTAIGEVFDRGFVVSEVISKNTKVILCFWRSRSHHYESILSYHVGTK